MWTGTRDRSWGIRPLGEAEPPGRAADEPSGGFWWLYVPLRFDDFAVVVIAQEEPDGQWKGRNRLSSSRYDLTDPAVAARIPYGVTDHVAHACCGDAVGWGCSNTPASDGTIRRVSRTGHPWRRRVSVSRYPSG